jgi:hypothetical protein
MFYLSVSRHKEHCACQHRGGSSHEEWKNRTRFIAPHLALLYIIA